MRPVEHRPLDILRTELLALPEADRARLESVVSPRALAEHLLAIALLERGRRALSLGGLAPQKSAIVRDERGRPTLPGPGDLNLSHGGGQIALALCRTGRVGIDLEAPRRPTDALLDATCTAEERAFVSTSRDVGDAFARLWTLKEAVMKALGTGLTLPPTAVSFSFHDRPTLLAPALCATFAELRLHGSVRLAICHLERL